MISAVGTRLLREDMRNYQTRGARFVKRHSRAGLFIDMGLGKTIIVLTALVDMLKAGTIQKVLVVAPVRVMQGVWRQEAKKWDHTKGLTFRLIDGSESQRLKALNSSAQIHIVSPDNLPWLMRVLASRSRKNGWPYDTLVIDESSMFKTPKSRRFTLLRHRVKRFERRIIMTGTPAPKSLLDVWSQVFILDEGHRLGEKIDRFRSRFSSPGGYYGKQRTVDEGAEEEVVRLISDIVLTMRAEDYLELPEVIEQPVYVDMPDKAWGLYRKLEEEMFLELECGSTEAVSAAVLSSKCWQIANGFLFLEDGDGDRTWQAIHDAKLHALKEVVEGIGGNVLVCYWFKPDLLRLKKLYPKAPCLSEAKNARELNKIQAEWNAGKHRVMFLHPQSTGHGLNLQVGGNAMVFYSMLWGREPYAQVKERIGAARQVGRVDNVLYKYLIARGTVDEAMLATQKHRFTKERDMLRMLKEYRDIREMLV